MGTRRKWEQSVTLNPKKVTKSNKMEAVIRIFRITASGSNSSYSERKRGFFRPFLRYGMIGRGYEPPVQNIEAASSSFRHSG